MPKNREVLWHGTLWHKHSKSREKADGNFIDIWPPALFPIELIRHYGELASDGTANTALLLAEIRALHAEVTELKTMMLRIDDKSAAVEKTKPKTAWWKLW